MTFHNVMVLIKSVKNKDKNNYCDRIDVSEGIDVNKTNDSKE